LDAVTAVLAADACLDLHRKGIEIHVVPVAAGPSCASADVRPPARCPQPRDALRRRLDENIELSGPLSRSDFYRPQATAPSLMDNEPFDRLNRQRLVAG